MAIPPQIQLIYVDRKTRDTLGAASGYFNIETLNADTENPTRILRVSDTITHQKILEVKLTYPRDDESYGFIDRARSAFLNLEDALFNKERFSDGSVQFISTTHQEFVSIDLTNNLGLLDFCVELPEQDVYICTDIESKRPLEGFTIHDALLYHYTGENLPVEEDVSIVMVAKGVKLKVDTISDMGRNLEYYYASFRRPKGPSERVYGYTRENTIDGKRLVESLVDHPSKDDPYFITAKQCGRMVAYESGDGMIGFTLSKNIRGEAIGIASDIFSLHSGMPVFVRDHLEQKWKEQLIRFIQNDETIDKSILVRSAIRFAKAVVQLEKGFREIRYLF